MTLSERTTGRIVSILKWLYIVSGFFGFAFFLWQYHGSINSDPDNIFYAWSHWPGVWVEVLVGAIAGFLTPLMFAVLLDSRRKWVPLFIIAINAVYFGSAAISFIDHMAYQSDILSELPIYYYITYGAGELLTIGFPIFLLWFFSRKETRRYFYRPAYEPV